jgi:hypothetical protein
MKLHAVTNNKSTFYYTLLFVFVNPGLPLSINGATPLTPSARISALNIVGDLLRKVGVGLLDYFGRRI